MRKIIISLIAFLLTAGIAIPPANAAFLFWKKVIGRSKTEAGCLTNARQNSLSNVHVTPVEVNGTSIDQKVYVAITCVERPGERAIMVVMGVGDDGDWVRRVVDDTAEQVRTAGVPD